jgi:carbon starvation protein CstA
MAYIKARLFALVLILIGSALIYINWHQLNTDGKYSLKLAAFAPLCVVGGVFLLLFPGRAGKPNTVSDKLITLAVFVIGLLAGLANWYLMDPGFFGQ